MAPAGGPARGCEGGQRWSSHEHVEQVAYATHVPSSISKNGHLIGVTGFAQSLFPSAEHSPFSGRSSMKRFGISIVALACIAATVRATTSESAEASTGRWHLNQLTTRGFTLGGWRAALRHLAYSATTVRYM